MINIKEKSTQEKYHNSIIIYSHRISGKKREEVINEISKYNPLLAAKCIMQCESNEEIERNIADVAESYAKDYEDIPRAANGYLSLIELRNFERFRNVLITLEHSSLRYLTFVFKALFNAVDANQVLSIIQSIVEIEQAKNGIKAKLLLDIMKFIIMSNIHFERAQVTQLIALYERINNTLRLSQLAAFLQCSKQNIIDFFSLKGIYLKTGENPNVRYAYLGYFVGQTKIVNKDKIIFAESFMPLDTSIGVPKQLLESILTAIKAELKIGHIYQKREIIDIIGKKTESATDKKPSSLFTEIKKLNIVSFDHLALDNNGIKRSFYKILSFPDISTLNFKSNASVQELIKIRKSTHGNEFSSPKPKNFIKRGDKNMPSELGEKLAAALRKKL